MDEQYQHFWDALKRLVDDAPVRVPSGTKISNDSVALEAGKARGSIKKSRLSYASLLQAISLERAKQSTKLSPAQRLKREKQRKLRYRDLYHQALNRELMLIDRLEELESRLGRFENVVPLFEK